MEGWDALSPWGTGIVAGAFLLGFIVSLLVPRRVKRGPVERGNENGKETVAAMRWRHEKLILAERQIDEKHRRLESFVHWLMEGGEALPARCGAALFFLGEAIREERNRVGSEISIMALVGGRLDAAHAAVAKGRHREGLSWAEEAQRAREEVRDLHTLLMRRQNALRSVFQMLEEKERGFFGGNGNGNGSTGDLRARLATIRATLSQLQGGLHQEVAVQKGRFVVLLRECPGSVPGEFRREIDALADVLSLDRGNGSAGALLPGGGGKAALVAAADKALRVFDETRSMESREARITKEAGDTRTDAKLEVKPDAKPDGNSPEYSIEENLPGPFLRPAVFEPEVEAEDESARVVPAVPGPFGGTEGLSPQDEGARGGSSREKPELVRAPVSGGDVADRSVSLEDSHPVIVFRSNDPALWNRMVYRGRNHRARAVAQLRDGLSWVSIERTDTGERVFCPASRDDLLHSGDGHAIGFNGTNELFYDARHLGLFSESCPSEVETRFTYGGWGFGHRTASWESGEEEPQAWGWEGREIPRETVFEIVAYTFLPKLREGDRVIRDRTLVEMP